MSRPALSATRSIEIMELLASFPERQFSLSDIVKATEINIASSHAILNALSGKGYITRHPKLKTYSLGPSLIAAGFAAQKAQPIVEHAIDAARKLREELDIPVLLSTVAGEELLAIFSLPDSSGSVAGMTVGERLPLVAPVGAPFLAWSPQEEIDAWIERRNTPLTPELRALLREDLHLTRERGYHVHLRPPERRTIGSLMAEMATSSHIVDYKDEVRKLIHEFSTEMCHPVSFVPETAYDVMLIASPIFDQEGRAAYSLAIGGFMRQLAGRQLLTYADRLSRTCLDIMRSDRSLNRRQTQGGNTPSA
ncbi:MAG: helix-turn-helix domain-containing protein [Novosphingobium sp.]|nr:helix-turn-helix domain-containing protein [Novosphingobium sp.]